MDRITGKRASIFITLIKKSLLGGLALLLFAAPWINGSKSKAESVVVDRNADVVFVIDATGSMSSYIESVKNNLTDFIEQVKEQGVDVNVRFVVYRDMTLSSSTEKTTSSIWYKGAVTDGTAANSIPKAVEYLSAISASGGGDYEETLLDGLGLMLKSDFGFRSDAKKYCIVLTDATSKADKTAGYDIALDNVKSKMKTAGINLSIISSISRTDCYEQYKPWVTEPSKDGLADGGILANIDGSYDILLKTLADRMVIGDHFIEPNHTLEGHAQTVKVYFGEGKVRKARTDKSIYGSHFFVKLNGTAMTVKAKELDYYSFEVPASLAAGTYTITANYKIDGEEIEKEVGDFYVFEDVVFDVFFDSMSPTYGYYTDSTNVKVKAYNVKEVKGDIKVHIEKQDLTASYTAPTVGSDGRYFTEISFTVPVGLAYPKSYPVSITLNETEYNIGSFYVKTNGELATGTGKHLFYDYLYGSPVGSTGITLYANGASVKLSSGEKKNYGQAVLYTDILASYIRKPKWNSLKTRITKVTSSTGKVIVGITDSNKEPTVSKGAIQIADKDLKKTLKGIASATILNGVVTVSAGKNNPDGRTVYLWVIDTGDVGTAACCPIKVLTSPTNINVYSTNVRGLEKTEKEKIGSSNFLEVNCGYSKMFYIDPIIVSTNGKEWAEAIHSTYSVTLKGKASDYFSVSRSGNYGFRVTAKDLKKDSKGNYTAATGKLEIKCDQNKTKAVINLKSSNMVETLNFTSGYGLSKADDGNFHYNISSDLSTGATLRMNTSLYSTYTYYTKASYTTDSVKIYPIGKEDGYKIENGKVVIDPKNQPSAAQKKITASIDSKFDSTKKTIRIKPGKATAGTTAYFLVVYNTTCANARRVISVTVTE